MTTYDTKALPPRTHRLLLGEVYAASVGTTENLAAQEVWAPGLGYASLFWPVEFAEQSKATYVNQDPPVPYGTPGQPA